MFLFSFFFSFVHYFTCLFFSSFSILCLVLCLLLSVFANVLEPSRTDFAAMMAWKSDDKDHKDHKDKHSHKTSDGSTTASGTNPDSAHVHHSLSHSLLHRGGDHHQHDQQNAAREGTGQEGGG